MSGVEGAEREDYDEREAGVGRLPAIGFRSRLKAFTTKDTKVHEGRRQRTSDVFTF